MVNLLGLRIKVEHRL